MTTTNTSVTICGLKNQVHLNGKKAVVLNVDTQTGRAIVQLVDTSHKKIAVKCENLDLGEGEFAMRLKQLTRPRTLDTPPNAKVTGQRLKAVAERTFCMLETFEPAKSGSNEDVVSYFQRMAREIDAIVEQVAKTNGTESQLWRSIDRSDEIVQVLMTQPDVKLCHAALYVVAVNLPCKNGLEGPVCVGASKIHGNGVFATREVEAGTFLSVYRADTIFKADPNNGPVQDMAHYMWRMIFSRPLLSQRRIDSNGVARWDEDSKDVVAAMSEETYRFTFDVGGVASRIDVCTSMPEVDNCIAHLINSFTTTQAQPTTSIAGSMNCIYVNALGGAVLMAVSTRSVAAGGEFLTYYGEDYVFG